MSLILRKFDLILKVFAKDTGIAKYVERFRKAAVWLRKYI